MAEHPFVFLLLLSLLFAVGHSNPHSLKIAFDSFYTMEFCQHHNGSATKKFASHSNHSFTYVKFKLDSEPDLAGAVDCTISLATDEGFRIFVTFSQLQLPPNKTDNFVRLESNGTSLVLGETNSCPTTNCSWGMFNTSEGFSDLSIQMVIAVNTTENLFTAGLTVFKEADAAGQCPSDYFRCDNNWCIWKELTCDGFNNCGDRSDENHEICHQKSKLMGILVIMLGITTLLIFLPVILFLAIQGAKNTVKTVAPSPSINKEEASQAINDQPQSSGDEGDKLGLNEHAETLSTLNLLDNQVPPANEILSTPVELSIGEAKT